MISSVTAAVDHKMVGPYRVSRDLNTFTIAQPGHAPCVIEYISPRDAEQAFAILDDEDLVRRVLAHRQRIGRRHHVFILRERSDFVGKLRHRRVGAGISVLEGDVGAGRSDLHAIRFPSEDWSLEQAEEYLWRTMHREAIAVLPATV